MNAQPTSPRIWMLALVFGGLITSDALASPTPILYYGTFGSVGGTSTGPVTFAGIGYDPILLPPNGIGYYGYSNSTVLPGSLDLGQFQTETIPIGGILTLNHTPFTINLNLAAAQGVGEPVKFAPNVTVSGEINGTLSGNGVSSLEAKIASVTPSWPGPLPFDISSLTTANPIILAPSGVSSGSTAFSLSVPTGISPSFFSIPEPTTLAVFATALVGLGFRRWLRVGN